MNRPIKCRATQSVRRFAELPLLLLLLGGTLVFVVSPALRVLTASAASNWSKHEISEASHRGWIGQELFPKLTEDFGYLMPIHLQWVGNTIKGPQDIHIGIGQPKPEEVPAPDVHPNRANLLHDNFAK